MAEGATRNPGRWRGRALILDRGPKPATRAGAYAHPFCAALDALTVDRKPSAAAEQAIAGHSASCLLYAQLFGRLPPPFAPCLKEAGYDLAAERATVGKMSRLARTARL